jgi:hypothetical protein
MHNSTIRTGVAVAAMVLVAAGCNEAALSPGVTQDFVPPTVGITTGGNPDTVDISEGLQFTVTAGDNLGLKNLSVTMEGGVIATVDSTFTSAVTSISVPFDVQFAEGSVAGGWVKITAQAVDGALNGASALDSIFLVNAAALLVTVLNPSDGAITSAGKDLLVDINATQRDGVKRVGYLFDGIITGGDSSGTKQVALPSDTTFRDTLTIPVGAAEGTFTLTGFAVDSADRRAISSQVVVNIQSAANDTDPPLVTFEIGARVEVDDTIRVNATDPSGITLIGWTAVDLAGDTVGGASRTLAGNLTDVTEFWVVGFNFTNLPVPVVITAFAQDAAGNFGTSATSPAPPAGARRAAAAAAGVDTVLVVAGVTTALPSGGDIADAIYNRNLNEVWLTNRTLNQLEVFQVANTTFAAPVPVGARPWGIALWPRNTAGDHDDTVVVANSGGTNFSIVNMQSRQEERRHQLPNFLVQSVQTEIDAATGAIKLKIIEFDFTDRPEYLGMTCIPTGGPGTACQSDQVFAIYSTDPTEAQPGDPVDFTERGTVRWENLTSATPESHFFWEQAAVAPSPQSDTLQIWVDRGPGTAMELVLSASCGRTVNLEELAFLDSTFVRNSGDFTHALIGEGGSSQEPPNGFARVIGYSRLTGHVTTACPPIVIEGVPFSGDEIVDLGISPALRVRDFIVNTAIPVKSIALNFNGLTNLVRADSIYVLDEGLRLMGLMSIGNLNSGMDMNFDHAFDARDRGSPPGTSDDRLVFGASDDPVIEVFDTYWYDKIAVIPVRDPITGPLRVSENAATGEQILVGVTANGVVAVAVPPITNPLPAPGFNWPRR